MAEREALTADYVRSILHYDPDTGEFVWKDRGKSRDFWNVKYAGHKAGRINSRGYLIISIDNHPYSAHRLAWLYVTGEWPCGQIDHINGVRSENRFSNIREATSAENNRNSRMQSNNTCGFKGVHFDKSRERYRACIMVDGRRKWLGRFSTAKEAHESYARAAVQLHGEFARIKS